MIGWRGHWTHEDGFVAPVEGGHIESSLRPLGVRELLPGCQVGVQLVLVKDLDVEGLSSPYLDGEEEREREREREKKVMEASKWYFPLRSSSHFRFGYNFVHV